MKKLFTLVLILSNLASKAQVCSQAGNLMIFTNYDGGNLTINVDQNIPNLKIGICSYEAISVTLTGAFVANVTAVHYAGFNGGNSLSPSCGPAVATTTIIGAPVGAVTSTVFAPPATLTNANGYGSIICGYSCNNTASQGGCNTVDQVEAYFLNYFTSSSLYAHMVQYGCWGATQNLSAGGNCCPTPVSQTLTAGTVSGSQTVCAGTYTTFTSLNAASGSTAAITYTWQSSFTSPTSGFTDIPGANSLTYLPLSGGPIYYRRAASTPVDPTVYSNVLSVFENPSPVILAMSIDPSTCSGSQATLVASSFGNTITSIWQPGSLSGNLITVTPLASMDFTVTSTDQNGCSSEEVVSVLVNPTPTLLVVTINTVCAGQQATLSASGASDYEWMPGNLSGSEVTVSPVSNTVYTVTGSFFTSCKDTQTLAVGVLPVPTVSLTSNKTKICKGETAILTASGALNYTMYTVAGPLLSASVVVSPTITTTFSVSGVASNGCADMALREVTVSVCSGIEENNLNMTTFQVYPNPSNGELFISGTSAASVNIINTSGQVVRTVELNSKNEYKTSVNNLAPGIYFAVSEQYKFKQKILVIK